MSHQKKTGHRLLADRLTDGAIRPETLDPFLCRIYALLDEHLANHTVNVNWLADQEAVLRTLVLTDPHAPSRFRVNGPLSNPDAFYTAFGIKEGDPMWRPVSERVVIW